jgi:hypothetical protein
VTDLQANLEVAQAELREAQAAYRASETPETNLRVIRAIRAEMVARRTIEAARFGQTYDEYNARAW